MLELLREKKAFAAIEIPADFSRRIIREGSASVLYAVNGSNIIMANVTSSAVKKISPATATLRVLGNPLQGYLLFFPIGMVLAAFQQGLLFTVGALVSFVLTIFALGKLLAISPRVAFLTLLILGGSFSFAVISFAEFFASIFSHEVNFVRASLMYPVPAFIFSGYTWPTESMSAAFQTAAGFFPLTWLSNAVRDLLLIGQTPHFEQNIFALTTLGAIFFALAFFVERNRNFAAASVNR